MQAAIGVAQMDKLQSFCEKRKAHFKNIFRYFQNIPTVHPAEATEGSDPAWFSFIVTLKSEIKFTREEITKYLNERLIETRICSQVTL